MAALVHVGEVERGVQKSRQSPVVWQRGLEAIAQELTSGPSRFGTVSPPLAVGVAIRPFANSQVAAVGPSFARTPFQLGRERRGPIHRDAAVMGGPSHRGRRAALAGPKPPPDGTRGGP
eukprot:CAMPEP_0119498890 /NCGR_PEP_ID=MMETSP1344-20130328/21520_1 /TAXON_ID=236787 /ORGANISM="Florenciella parvula, Strain CCMP2471" /LENGTH=118 /DNA_ID=CAMNT_0007534827 /DNA_START=422 /DNA_END=776 /DNA_ORIENTATION=+